MENIDKLRVGHTSLDMMLQKLESTIKAHMDNGRYYGQADWLTKYQELKVQLYERMQKDK